MKGKSTIIAALIIGAAIVVLGFSLKAAFDNFTNRDRQVTVRGLCEKEVQANKVTWPIVTNEVGNDLLDIYGRIQKKNSTILTFLTSNGLSEKEISVNPPQVYDRYAESYSERANSRYSVTNVIVVTSDNVELVRNLISRQSELLAKGIAIAADNYQYRVSYEFTGLNDVKPEMIAEATANAREAGERFAADSHSKLGKIRTAQQGQFSISNRDEYTPEIKTIRVVTYVTYSLRN